MKVVLTLLMFFGFVFAQSDSKKLVIDLTTASVSQYEAKILNGIVMHKQHYKNLSQELKVAVVIHGSSYKFFFKKLDETQYENDVALQKVFVEFKKRTQELSQKYDVEFLMCGFGMKKYNIKKDEVVEYVKVVANATVGLIDKQNEGYAFLPVGD